MGGGVKGLFHWFSGSMDTPGARDNGPYADSFPLLCHFHDGGGGVVPGVGGGRARGSGGAPDLDIWLEMATSSLITLG